MKDWKEEEVINSGVDKQKAFLKKCGVVPASTIDKRREQIWDILTKEGMVMKMGNFDAALLYLIQMLKDSADKGNRDCREALRKWDSIRGTDWYRKEGE